MTEAMEWTHCKEWRFPSGWDQEKPVLGYMREAALHYGFPLTRIEDIVTAAAEACLNAAEHGNKMKHEKFVKVWLWTDPSGLQIRVYDEGLGLQEGPQTTREGNVLQGNPRGWGMVLMAGLTDELSFGQDDEGFYTQLMFRRARGEPDE